MEQAELRQQAAISILNSLLETTPHSVVESPVIKDLYAHVAVWYADSLINALSKETNDVEKFITEHLPLCAKLLHEKKD